MFPESKIRKSQTKVFQKSYLEDDQKYYIIVKIRYDDQCGNGHNSFAITADIYRANASGNLVKSDRFFVSGGCCHDEIAKHFPELEKYIKWHLCSSDGPMHYLANTLYHAGNRDHNGHAMDEPDSFKKAIRFGNVPINHKVKLAFYEFLKNGCSSDYDLEILEIEHKKDSYPFKPKYTYSGFADEWYDCPFDTMDEAINFLYDLQNCEPKFIEIATSWSKGKERELDSARSTAIWPEATNDQLSLPKDQLKVILEDRLPQLLFQFKKAIKSLDFTY